MNAAAIAGALLAVGGLVGYVIGLAAAYPGRAFSLTALMAGLTIVAVSQASGGSDA